jgi:uncharacterized protein YegP (UPF0339 family)
MGKFVLNSAKGGKFRWNLQAGNSQNILTSEIYNTKRAALNGAASVAKNCGNEKCFDRKVAKNGKPYFNMKSTNGQIIGSSQMYANKTNMENGIASVKKNAPTAPTDDRS